MGPIGFVPTHNIGKIPIGSNWKIELKILVRAYTNTATRARIARRRREWELLEEAFNPQWTNTA